MTRLDRITADPEVVHGKPAIRGTRIMVQTVLELLAAGATFEELLAEYDELERDDILAALEYGSLTVGGQVIPLGAA